MRPHTLFYDETYSEEYHRKDTVMDFVQRSDCLVLVGTGLTTSLAKQIVCTFLDKDLPVIELNL